LSSVYLSHFLKSGIIQEDTMEHKRLLLYIKENFIGGKSGKG